MPKTKQQKQTILDKLEKNLSKQGTILLVDFKGLKVKDMMSLRQQVRKSGGSLMVAKKTLFQKALEKKGIDINARKVEGQVAAVFATEDPIAPLKSVYLFSKSNENVKIVGGYFEEKYQDASSMVTLATLPSREELLGRLVGSIASPMSQFMTVLQGNIKGLVVALNAIATK